MERRNLPALFGALPFLRELDEKSLQEISGEIEWFSLPGGTVLYEAGQDADGLYIVINGALATYAKLAAGGSRLVGQILAREIAGEMELISGEPRSMTVIALRDTEVARVTRPLFETLIQRFPASLWQLTKSLVLRLDALQQPDKVEHSSKRIFAVVPHDSFGIDGAEFGARLTDCLHKIGRAELVVRSRAAEQTSHWFHRIERANDYVVYVTDARPTNWTKLCMRQAQTLLLLAYHDQEARPWRALADQDQVAALQSCELVLQQRGATKTIGTGRWLDVHPCLRHHHVGDAADMARVARLLTGHGTGIVLSGGGARGFAHIGALRALQESAVPIDATGGTSIGAIIAALWAAGMDYKQLTQCIRRSFVDANPLNDYTLPMLSLVAGSKVGTLLRREFGELDIEDLKLPFYCLSANLTTGQAAIHRRGKVWLWLRASVAIPGVLPPVCTGRQIYVDGATINNLPVDVMREIISGRVIGVDAGADHAFESDVELTEMPLPWNFLTWMRSRRPRINITQVLWRAGMVNSAAMTLGQRAMADLLLKPPLGQIDMLDWHAFERVVEIGYRHTMDALESKALADSTRSTGVAASGGQRRQG